MPYDASSTIAAFLDATAARQPAPGGGSVTALVGALSAAIGEMVLNYSVGRKVPTEHEAELRDVLGGLNRARRLMLALMAEDQDGYASLTAARKLPADAPGRQQLLDVSLLASIRAPQAMGATAVAVLELCDRSAAFVNPHLLSDLAVCADLAMAAVRCSVYNVRVNLAGVTDAEERGRFDSATSQTLSRGAVLIQKVAPRIWARMS